MIRPPPRSTRTDTLLSLHDALPIYRRKSRGAGCRAFDGRVQRPVPLRQRDLHARRAPDMVRAGAGRDRYRRAEEHTSELQSLMRISYAVFCLTKKNAPGSLNMFYPLHTVSHVQPPIPIQPPM